MIDSKAIKAIIDKFENKEGVRGVIIADSNGLPIKSNMDITKAENVSAYIMSLIGKAESCVEALDEGALNFIRLETARGEVMIARQEELILIILK